MQVLLAAYIVAMVVGLPAAGLAARDMVRESRSLVRDASLGVVRMYAGKLIPAEIGRDTLRQVVRLMPPPVENGMEWHFETLGASGRLWRICGKPVKQWVVLKTVSVAEAPPIAGIAAQWLEPVSTPGGKTILAGRRELSKQEREEVRLFARRLWTRPLPIAVGLTVWLGLPMTAVVVSGELHTAVAWGRFVILAGLTGLNCYWLYTCVKRARLLVKDANAGSILIVSRTEETRLAEPAGDREPTIIEVLPSLGWRWTEDGRPSAWRKVRP